MKKPRVLIVTLYSGENEYSDAVESIKKQTYLQWEHKVFRDLANVEGHRTLYRCIMDSVNEFDLFVKLDADMVFNRASALADIVDEFQKNNELDHAVFSVHDWASDQDIIGIHAYSNRVRWPHSNEDLFVDPRPQTVGRRHLFWHYPAPVAHHMPNPSLEQAYLFGCHRALKVVQRGRLRKNVEYAETQLSILQGVWRAYKSTRERRRAAVLWGAERVFAGKDLIMEDKSRACQPSELHDFEQQGQERLDTWLTKRWETGYVTTIWRKWQWTLFPRWIMPLITITRVGRRILSRTSSFVAII